MNGKLVLRNHEVRGFEVSIQIPIIEVGAENE